MLRVACVLRSGGAFGPEAVAALRSGVQRWMRRTPHRFVCLTDMSGVGADEVLPLREGWPGWWSKIELFDGRLSGPVLYIDLDTIITGPLDDIALGHKFTVLRNFLRAECIGSGLMAWCEDLRAIHRAFSLKPHAFMREYRTMRLWGDQAFILRHTPVQLDYWQRLHPGKVVSFKLHCMPEGRVPRGASVVCFHGPPRPWNMSVTQRQWFDTEDDYAGSVHPGLRVAGP